MSAEPLRVYEIGKGWVSPGAASAALDRAEKGAGAVVCRCGSSRPADMDEAAHGRHWQGGQLVNCLGRAIDAG